MKTYLTVAAMFVLAAVTGSAFASTLAGAPANGDPWVLAFDEDGNGSININGTGFVDYPGALAPDPTRGGALALTFPLPGIVYNGDVRIWEPPTNDFLSDVIRFTDEFGNLTGATADRMLFYSDPGEINMADIDDFFSLNLVPGDGGGIIETGIDGGWQDFTWAPGGTGDNIYYGISETPEPATLSLLALGGLALMRRRR